MYVIYADDAVIHSSDDQTLARHVVSAKLVKHANQSDSFNFSIGPAHPLRSSIIKMRTLIKVVYNGRVVFHGRPLSESINILGQRSYECEDCRGFLNDSYRESYKNSVKPLTFFEECINGHNKYAQESKRVKVGVFSHSKPDEQVNIEVTNYGTTLYSLSSGLLKACPGFILYRYEPDGVYLDYYEKYPETVSNQALQFAENIVDIKQKSSTEGAFSILIPTGKKGITVQSVNDGSPEVIVSQEALDELGVIKKVHSFSDAETPEALMESALKYIDENFSTIPDKFTVTAIDLSAIDQSVDTILPGDVALVHFESMGIHEHYQCTDVELDFDKPQSTKYTFGLVGKMKLNERRSDSYASGIHQFWHKNTVQSNLIRWDKERIEIGISKNIDVLAGAVNSLATGGPVHLESMLDTEGISGMQSLLSSFTGSKVDFAQLGAMASDGLIKLSGIIEEADKAGIEVSQDVRKSVQAFGDTQVQVESVLQFMRDHNIDTLDLSIVLAEGLGDNMTQFFCDTFLEKNGIHIEMPNFIQEIQNQGYVDAEGNISIDRIITLYEDMNGGADLSFLHNVTDGMHINFADVIGMDKDGKINIVDIIDNAIGGDGNFNLKNALSNIKIGKVNVGKILDWTDLLTKDRISMADIIKQATGIDQEAIESLQMLMSGQTISMADLIAAGADEQMTLYDFVQLADETKSSGLLKGVLSLIADKVSIEGDTVNIGGARDLETSLITLNAELIDALNEVESKIIANELTSIMAKIGTAGESGQGTGAIYVPSLVIDGRLIMNSPTATIDFPERGYTLEYDPEDGLVKHVGYTRLLNGQLDEKNKILIDFQHNQTEGNAVIPLKGKDSQVMNFHGKLEFDENAFIKYGIEPKDSGGNVIATKEWVRERLSKFAALRNARPAESEVLGADGRIIQLFYISNVFGG